MKITKRQLRGIIREEVNRALNEYRVPAPIAGRRYNDAPPSDYRLPGRHQDRLCPDLQVQWLPLREPEFLEELRLR